MDASSTAEARTLVREAEEAAARTRIDGRKFYYPVKADRQEAHGARQEAREASEAHHQRERELLEMEGINVPWELHRLLSGIVDAEEAEQGQPCVDARRLWELLGGGMRFNDWWKQRVDDCGLRDGQDFYWKSSKTPSDKGGRPQQNYLLTLDAARMVAMITHSDTAKQARRWFAWRMALLDKMLRERIERADREAGARARAAAEMATFDAAKALANELGIYHDQARRRIERSQGVHHTSADVKRWESGGIYGIPGLRWEKEREEAWERTRGG